MKIIILKIIRRKNASGKNISLLQLVNAQPITGMSDLEIIKTWFIQNNYEQEGLILIADLSKSKADKLERVLCNARTWIPTLSTVTESLRVKVGEEFARKFDIIVSMYLLDMKLNDELLNWAKETIPNMKTPKVIFQPALKWLKNEYGIEFKDKTI